MATTLENPFDSKTGVGTNVIDATAVTTSNPSGSVLANYTGAPIQFGPYTIGGLGAAATVTLPSNAGLQTYTKFSVNGGAYGATGTVNNGDTLTVQFDLATYISDFNGGPLVYASTLSPKVKIGTPTVTFSVQMCGNPNTPPPTGGANCS